MKIVADDKIPLIDELFQNDQLIKIPGQNITSYDLADADVLWVRSITSVNQTLLRNSSIKFVGTATSGTDHLDTEYLSQRGISWASSKGANANAVAEYVICCIAVLKQQGLLQQSSLRAGIIGVGHAGHTLYHKLIQLGFDVILNDPPRAASEADFISTPLTQFSDLDLICLHPSLTKEGPYPSYHLIDDHFLNTLKPGCVLINASRGAVIDNNALLKHPEIHACLDVWENEPNINLELLEKVTIATPHIAGYTREAKHRASIMLYQKMRHVIPAKAEIQNLKSLLDPRFRGNDIVGGRFHEHNVKTEDNFFKHADWVNTALTFYNPSNHSTEMRNILLNNLSKTFEQLRCDFSLRREFTAPLKRT